MIARTWCGSWVVLDRRRVLPWLLGWVSYALALAISTITLLVVSSLARLRRRAS